MENTTAPWSLIKDSLAELYLECDLKTGELFTIHKHRLFCRPGCTQCCIDGITVFEVEARNIRERAADLLSTGNPAPVGICAFLGEEGTCRIYSHRPYVCRTQGLPLRWLEESGSKEVVQMRDICPKNENGPALESIPGHLCWTIGPFELRLAALQALLSGSEMRRVPLRSLFDKSQNGFRDVNMQEPSDPEVDIEIGECMQGDYAEVLGLLDHAGLLTADLTPEKLRHFLVGRTTRGSVVGAVGCEPFEGNGLVRSLVVHPGFRHAGLGRILAEGIQDYAREQGVTTLYLLTLTATDFFSRLGFTVMDRADVPGDIASTAEFSSLCPAAAVCMVKHSGG